MEYKMPDPLDEDTLAVLDTIAQHSPQADGSLLGMDRLKHLEFSSASSGYGSDPLFSQLACQEFPKPRIQPNGVPTLLHDSVNELASSGERDVLKSDMVKQPIPPVQTPTDLEAVGSIDEASDSEESFAGVLADVSAVTDISCDPSYQSHASASQKDWNQEENNYAKEEPADEPAQPAPAPSPSPFLGLPSSKLQALVKAALFFILFNSFIGKTSLNSSLDVVPEPIEIVYDQPAPTSDPGLITSKGIPAAPGMVPNQLFSRLRSQADSPVLPLVLIAALSFGIYHLGSHLARRVARISKRMLSRQPTSTLVKMPQRLPDRISMRVVDYKTYLIGAPRVGVASLFHRQIFRTLDDMVSGKFESQIQKFARNNLTVALAFHRAPRRQNGGKTCFTSPNYGRDKISVLVFDLTREDTFRLVQAVGDKIKSRPADQQCHLFLVGNKADLVAGDSALGETARKWAESQSIPYEEVSALTGENVDQAFRAFVRHLRAHCPRCA